LNSDFTDRPLDFCVTDLTTNWGLAMWPLAMAGGGVSQIPARWWSAGGEGGVGKLQGGKSYLSVASVGDGVDGGGPTTRAGVRR